MRRSALLGCALTLGIVAAAPAATLVSMPRWTGRRRCRRPGPPAPAPPWRRRTPSARRSVTEW